MLASEFTRVRWRRQQPASQPASQRSKIQTLGMVALTHS